MPYDNLPFTKGAILSVLQFLMGWGLDPKEYVVPCFPVLNDMQTLYGRLHTRMPRLLSFAYSNHGNGHVQCTALWYDRSLTSGWPLVTSIDYLAFNCTH